jgi:hypothetical protein
MPDNLLSAEQHRARVMPNSIVQGNSGNKRD